MADNLFEGMYQIGYDTAKKIIEIDFAKAGTTYDARMILDRYTVTEAMDAILEYEKKKNEMNDEICVGDEVYISNQNYPSVVTCIFSETGSGCKITDNPKAVHITRSGKTACTPVSMLHKTGKHYFQIESVLKELQQAAD